MKRAPRYNAHRVHEDALFHKLQLPHFRHEAELLAAAEEFADRGAAGVAVIERGSSKNRHPRLLLFWR